MNIFCTIRRYRLEVIIVVGLLVLILMCVWPQIIAWPLFPIARTTLSGTWESNPIGTNRVYLIFTDQDVRLQSKECCKLSSSYSISIMDDTIVYLDGQGQQSYWIGKSLESFFITGDQPQITIMITSPGPIPMGAYIHSRSEPPRWEFIR